MERKTQSNMTRAANSSAGQMITWVFIPLIGISSVFAYERQRGTLRRLLTTPTGKGTYLLGTILGNVFWALVQMTLLVTFGALVMKVNWADNPAALAVMMTASALAAAALGTMLGTFVKTEGQASGLSIMLGMVMALLGGCWYPIELFPAVVRNIVKVLPTTWAMQGMLDILLRGQGVVGILPCGYPAWLCGGVLRDRHLAVQVRIIWQGKRVSQTFSPASEHFPGGLMFSLFRLRILDFRRAQGVLHQHGDRHRADAAGDGGDEPGHFLGLLEVHIAHQPVAALFCAVPSGLRTS